MAAIEAPNAAQGYCAAFERLQLSLVQGWLATDWQDRSLCWRFYRPKDAPVTAQGWKIHVSTCAAQARACLAVLTPLLARLQIPFKLPRRISDIVFINSGDAGIEQLGKIITLYPHNEQQARAALLQLDRCWPVSDGPQVVSDLHVRPGSAVSFRFGVFHAGIEIIGSTGVHEFALRLADGRLVADQRLRNGQQPCGAPPSPLPGYLPGERQVRLKAPIQVGQRDYVPLLLLGETARASTFLVVDVDTLETAVLKAGTPGVAGDCNGQDIRYLLRQEADILQALHSWPGLAPQLLQVSAGDWPMLVSQDFRGVPLGELPRRERIDCLPLLGQAIATLHHAGFVHGDIKLENAIRHATGVGLIDFELAARHGNPIRPSGTPGYLAPEVNGSVRPADTARDVYALAGCVFQAVLDIPPGLLPAQPQRLLALLCNEGASQVAASIAPWLAALPGQRPSAQQATAMLRANLQQWRAITPHAGRQSSARQLRWYRRASADAAQLAGTFMRPAQHGACWRNEHFMRPFECEAVNIGAAGILLGLRSIDCALGRSDHCEVIAQGADWLAARPAEGNAAGLFTGNAGVALALAVAGKYLGSAQCLAASRLRLQVAARDLREIDLFSGSAGVVWAACLLHALLDEAWPLECAREAVNNLNACASVAADVPVWAMAGARQTSHFGCAHGSAGIAMALARWGQFSADHAALETARDTFRRIAQHGRTAQGEALRIGPDEPRQHAVGNWCHGVAGYLWAMFNGLGDDPALRVEIDWAVGVFAGAMSVGTPTYCHGLAGQLELWRLLQHIPRFQPMAQARAGKVANALRLMHSKVQGRCTWHSDDPGIVTPDLWVGFLGPATALALHASGSAHALLSAPWLAQCTRHVR
ncbi:class III lanthionine synthetase LanKC N-terminal domain-containing protein [Pseudomonas putida]